MGKSSSSNAKATPVRAGHEPKAGKKRIFKEPPSPNPAKKAAREAGRQQFVAKHQLTAPGTKIVFDKLSQMFVTKIIEIPVPFIYDETRKQFVFSPVVADREEK